MQYNKESVMFASIAMTHEPVDLVFCALMLVWPLCYVVYRHRQYKRTTMGWSSMRTHLRAMRRYL